MSDAVLQAVDVGREFVTPTGVARIFHGVSFSVTPGELVVVRGQSGSGKTTLLNILTGLDRPTSGEVYLGADRVDTLSESGLAQLRRDRIGIVFQTFGLLPVLTAAENVELALRLRNSPVEDRNQRVADALSLVGLLHHSAQRPDELSGGQQQRVGIARAIVTRPPLIVADEPTAQLDSATSARVVDVLMKLVDEQGVAAVVATHDETLAERATRIVVL